MSDAKPAPPDFVAFCQRYFPTVFHQPFAADQLAIVEAVQRLLMGLTPAVESYSLDRGRGVTALTLAGAMFASFEWRLSCVTVMVDFAEHIGNEVLFGFQRCWDLVGPHWAFWYSRHAKAWLFGWRDAENATDRLIHVTARRQCQYLQGRSSGRIRRPQLVLMDNVNSERAAYFSKRMADDGASVLILHNHETRPEAVRDGNPPRPSSPGHG